MSTETHKVDVLAVMDYLTSRYIANRGTNHQFISCVTPEVFGDDEAIRKSQVGAGWLDLLEARAAVAELIDASRPALEELRAYISDCEDYEAPELVDELEATTARFEAALARLEVRHG